MGNKKIAEKLGDYFARLDEGKAQKIKPRDVDKIIEKLQARRVELDEARASAPGRNREARLTQKIETVDILLERATWLRSALAATTGPEAQARLDVSVPPED